MHNSQFAQHLGLSILRQLCIMHLAASLVLTSCSPPTPFSPPTPTAGPTITITVIADGQTQRFALPQTLTVREALNQAGIALGELDRVQPGPATRLTDGVMVTVTRIRETFETEDIIIPFTSETLKNEGLPQGERRLLQAGANGQQTVTYRTVFENGVQVSRSVIDQQIIQEAVPEIIVVGAQASFTVVPISGTLTYISGSNAWAMRGDSGKRTPLTTSGDVDGRIFDLSPDGQFILFSRVPTDTNGANFNSLWVITTTAPTTGTAASRFRPISLPVSNTLYAEWSPIQTISPTIAFSTAENTPGRAPGWQANNDLWLMDWGIDRRTRRLTFNRTQILDSNQGGVYGWWGTGYAFAPDGLRIAYARTDSVGVIDLATFERTELLPYVAYNTRRDWAWFPALSWANSEWLYTVQHGAPLGLELPEDSPVFDLTALSSTSGLALNLVPRAGIFSNPVVSSNGQNIAFLQATDPNNSPFSRYRLAVMDRDGSNLRALFPAEDQPGLEAGALPTWSPDGRLIAIIYQGNLWLINTESGVSQQLTGDGLTTRVEWGK